MGGLDVNAIIDPRFNEAPALRGGKRRARRGAAAKSASFNEAPALRGGKPRVPNATQHALARARLREVANFQVARQLQQPTICGTVTES